MKDKEKQKFEFKVIDKKTGEEADTYKIALKEDWAKGLIYCDMEGFAILEDGNLVLLDECGKWEYCPSDRFEIIPEGSVVLSREEWARLRNLEINYNDTYEDYRKYEIENKALKQELKQVRKETAREIFNKIKIKALTEDMTEDRPQTLYRFTSFDIMKMSREIVEEFGVVFENGHATIKE